MNWTHVFLAAYVAMIVTLVVTLLRRKGKVGKISSVAIIVVAIFAWNTFDVLYLMPREKKSVALSSEQEVDAAFRSISSLPTFQVLQEQEPQLYAEIRATVSKMHKEGKTGQHIIDYMQPQILNVQMARLQNAPDDQVTAYMQANIQQTAAIQKTSDDNCFRFLFPAVKGGMNPVKVLSQDAVMHRMNVDAAMMRSAYGVSKHTVTVEERQAAQQHLVPVIETLVRKYGKDIELMENPVKAIGKEKVACELVQDLWNNVLALPQDQAAGIIRMVLAEENR